MLFDSPIFWVKEDENRKILSCKLPGICALAGSSWTAIYERDFTPRKVTTVEK